MHNHPLVPRRLMRIKVRKPDQLPSHPLAPRAQHDALELRGRVDEASEGARVLRLGEGGGGVVEVYVGAEEAEPLGVVGGVQGVDSRGGRLRGRRGGHVASLEGFARVEIARAREGASWGVVALRKVEMAPEKPSSRGWKRYKEKQQPPSRNVRFS